MTRNMLKFSVLSLTICTVMGLSVSFANGKAKMPMVDIAGKAKVTLEVADTEPKITRGLMYRTSLAPDAGMVFLFRPNREVNFWMYHTLIPLDMLFVHNGKVVKLIADVQPCKSENPSDCATYPGGRGVFVSEVIELAAGYAKQHDLKEGDTITFNLP